MQHEGGFWTGAALDRSGTGIHVSRIAVSDVLCRTRITADAVERWVTGRETRYQNKDDSIQERWKTAEHCLAHSVLCIQDSRERGAPRE